MPPLRTLAVLVIALGFVTDADAAMRRVGMEQLEDGEILVQAQRSMTIRSTAADDKSQDQAIQLIYRMAERECALILETIGSACELVGISTSLNSNEDGSERNVIRASGNFSMKVKLKS